MSVICNLNEQIFFSVILVIIENRAVPNAVVTPEEVYKNEPILGIL